MPDKTLDVKTLDPFVRVPSASLTTTLNAVEAQRSEMLNKAKAKLATDLGIPVENIQGEILKKLEESLDRQLKAKIEGRHIHAAISSTLQKPDAIKPALRNLGEVMSKTLAMQEFRDALANNADLLFKTYQAFVKAGFSTEQAFQIVLSQLKH